MVDQGLMVLGVSQEKGVPGDHRVHLDLMDNQDSQDLEENQDLRENKVYRETAERTDNQEGQGQMDNQATEDKEDNQASLDLKVDQDHKVNQACVVMPEKEDPVDLLDKMAALVTKDDQALKVCQDSVGRQDLREREESEDL